MLNIAQNLLQQGANADWEPTSRFVQAIVLEVVDDMTTFITENDRNESDEHVSRWRANMMFLMRLLNDSTVFEHQYPFVA